jgi:hypothetical protein
MPKTERYPEKDDGIGFKGTLSMRMDLSGEERQQVRRILAGEESAIHMSMLAAKIGMPVGSLKFSGLARYVVTVLAPIEAEMAFEAGKRGERFTGGRATRKLKDLISKGL